MSRLLQVDVLTAQGEVQVSCRKLLVDKYSNIVSCEFVHKKVLNFQFSQKFLLTTKSQKYAATYYSKAVLKPEPKKKISGTCQKEAPFILKYPLGCSLI